MWVCVDLIIIIDRFEHNWVSDKEKDKWKTDLEIQMAVYCTCGLFKKTVNFSIHFCFIMGSDMFRIPSEMLVFIKNMYPK